MACPQAGQELPQVRRERRLEAQRPLVGRMAEGQGVRVQRLARERNARAAPIGSDVAPLADERVATQLRLDANLILLSRLEPHLDQCRGVEALEHPVCADRVHAPGIVGPRLPLDQCLVAPRQAVAPFAGVGRQPTVQDGPIHALGLAPEELLLQVLLGAGVRGEEHQTRGVAVDPVHDQRQSLVRSPVLRQEIGD